MKGYAMYGERDNGPGCRSDHLGFRAAPNPLLRPAQLRELRRAQRRLTRREKLIQLGRAYRRAAQHGVGLAAMMHLVLEQMQEQAVHPLALDGGAAMHGDDAL